MKYFIVCNENILTMNFIFNDPNAGNYQTNRCNNLVFCKKIKLFRIISLEGRGVARTDLHSFGHNE